MIVRSDSFDKLDRYLIENKYPRCTFLFELLNEAVVIKIRVTSTGVVDFLPHKTHGMYNSILLRPLNKRLAKSLPH